MAQYMSLCPNPLQLKLFIRDRNLLLYRSILFTCVQLTSGKIANANEGQAACATSSTFIALYPCRIVYIQMLKIITVTKFMVLIHLYSISSLNQSMYKV